MLRRARYRFSFWLARWPNVTGTLAIGVSVFAAISLDPELFRRAGALLIFSAFWQFYFVFVSFERKRNVNDGVDLSRTRSRYEKPPELKSDGAKELWRENKDANSEFWDTAEDRRETIEETIADRAKTALVAGSLGSLQLGFGDFALKFCLQYIEN